MDEMRATIDRMEEIVSRKKAGSVSVDRDAFLRLAVPVGVSFPTSCFRE